MTRFAPYHFNYKVYKSDDARIPILQVQHALALYNEYLMHRSKKLKILFLNCTDSLVDRLVLRGDFSVWPYYYVFSRAQMYGCKIPWVSALAQGQGISVLVRAYSLTQNEKYLLAARHSLGAFKVPMKDGGVLSVDDDNDWWYEEYACAKSKPSGVLNGFIFALLGIYDFHLMMGDKVSKQLFEEGISTLRNHLRDFDTNCPYKLTYYDRQKHIVAFPYHLLHIKLVKILHDITGKEIFKIYQKKWERYKREWLTHRMYRWLSKFYYVRSGHNFGDSAKLLLRLAFERKPVFLEFGLQR